MYVIEIEQTEGVMSDKFTKIIFKKRDLPRSTGDVVGWLWTKK